jgi:hypothetical protein
MKKGVDAQAAWPLGFDMPRRINDTIMYQMRYASGVAQLLQPPRLLAIFSRNSSVIFIMAPLQNKKGAA